MIRSSAAFLLALPVGVTLTAVPALAQYAPPPPPGAYYQERLPPVVGGYDDEEDLAPPPRNMRRGARALPYPDDEPPLPPPGLYGAPGQRSSGYGQQPYQQPQQSPPMSGRAFRGVNDPDSLRPPAGIGRRKAHRSKARRSHRSRLFRRTISRKPARPKELPPNLKKQLVDYSTREPAGTLIIDTPNTYLYLVLGGGKALALRHRRWSRRIHLDRYRADQQDVGMAGLASAVGDDRPSTVFAAVHGGRTWQSARRTRALSRARRCIAFTVPISPRPSARSFRRDAFA